MGALFRSHSRRQRQSDLAIWLWCTIPQSHSNNIKFASTVPELTSLSMVLSFKQISTTLLGLPAIVEMCPRPLAEMELEV